MLKFWRSPWRFCIILYHSFVRLKYIKYLFHLITEMSCMVNEFVPLQFRYGWLSIVVSHRHGISARPSVVDYRLPEFAQKPKNSCCSPRRDSSDQAFVIYHIWFGVSIELWHPSPDHVFLAPSRVVKVLLLQSVMVWSLCFNHSLVNLFGLLKNRTTSIEKYKWTLLSLVVLSSYFSFSFILPWRCLVCLTLQTLLLLAPKFWIWNNWLRYDLRKFNKAQLSSAKTFEGKRFSAGSMA